MPFLSPRSSRGGGNVVWLQGATVPQVDVMECVTLSCNPGWEWRPGAFRLIISSSEGTCRRENPNKEGKKL